MLEIFEEFTKQKYPKYAEGKSKRDCKTSWYHFCNSDCEYPLTMGSLITKHRDLLTFVKLEKRDIATTKHLKNKEKEGSLKIETLVILV